MSTLPNPPASIVTKDGGPVGVDIDWRDQLTIKELPLPKGRFLALRVALMVLAVMLLAMSFWGALILGLYFAIVAIAGAV